MISGNMVDITGVKEFAMRLPISSTLREIILSEPDSMPSTEFVSKSGIWLKLFERENRNFSPSSKL